jgi:tetratricopeptide (TPR) repeat protein
MRSRLLFFAALCIHYFAFSPVVYAQQVKADTGGVAIGGNVSSSTINIGIPAEQLAALVRQNSDLSETQKKLIAKLEDELELNQQQIRAALNILGEANVPSEWLGAKLFEFAERFKVLQGTALAQPNDGPRIAALKVDVQKAIDAGELAKADALLSDVENEQRRALDNVAVNAADTALQRGKIAFTRLRYREAAMHFANAAAVLPHDGAHERKRISYLNSEASALSQQGAEFGDNGALLLAIERYKQLVAQEPREDAPLRWALMQTRLGNALAMLGERDTNAAKLEEAVAAYREALKERTRERTPFEWAIIQTNLGNALLSIGDRESSATRLEEAIAAYREALKESTRERVPLEWARTQAYLCAALRALGTLESDTARLQEAAAACREALKESTRERVPLNWARAQANLANALLGLGTHENDTAKLEDAVAVYREALKELTRERQPLDWAKVQYSLGVALVVLGKRANDTPRLEEAIAAYREALLARTRERVPLDWALTQRSIAQALLDLGTRENDTATLDEAIAAYREALKELTRERVPLDWALTQRSIAQALLDLGTRESDTATLDEAIAAYREALKELTRESAPIEWAQTQKGLGSALKVRGYVRFYQGDFAAAVSALQEAADGTDAYPILWLYLARVRAGGQDAKRDLELGAAGLKPAQWPSPVIKMFLEQGTPEAMLAAADKPDERCEAQYYLGQWDLLRDKRANSVEALQNAVKSCPRDFIEYAGALAELKRLAQ